MEERAAKVGSLCCCHTISANWFLALWPLCGRLFQLVCGGGGRRVGSLGVPHVGVCLPLTGWFGLRPAGVVFRLRHFRSSTTGLKDRRRGGGALSSVETSERLRLIKVVSRDTDPGYKALGISETSRFARFSRHTSQMQLNVQSLEHQQDVGIITIHHASV